MAIIVILKSGDRFKELIGRTGNFDPQPMNHLYILRIAFGRSDSGDLFGITRLSLGISFNNQSTN